MTISCNRCKRTVTPEMRRACAKCQMASAYQIREFRAAKRQEQYMPPVPVFDTFAPMEDMRSSNPEFDNSAPSPVPDYNSGGGGDFGGGGASGEF